MEVRKLTQEERYQASLISTLAFHMRREDLDKLRKESLEETADDWGAFDADGRLMAHIINHRFQSYLDGGLIVNGGIGAVSTLPEYRNDGAVKAIFSKLLTDACRSGEVISTLFPFSHAFYRKFGYETARWQNVYCFPPDALRDYRFAGQAEQWQPGMPVDAYTKLYNRFASDFNLAIHRDDHSMLEAHVRGEWYKDRKFCYLLRDGDHALAYLIFQDVWNEPGAILSVRDAAWEGAEGFRAILGFLARFSADYHMIELSLPDSLELLSVIHSSKTYDIKKTARQNYMIRVINAQKLLSGIRKPDRCSFAVQVSDAWIPENNGTWQVTEEAVRPVSGAADLSVSVQALGQLASGCASLGEAAYREDVKISGKRDVLERVFPRKPVWMAENF